ncbi:MAG: FHA domain-containing protein [Anaerolineae bacterium]
MSVGKLVEQDSNQVFPLGFEVVTIGRQGDNAIILADPGVSRHHAEISMQGGRWVIRDLDSANGTFVNGRRIVEPRLLRHGDLVRIGQTSFQVEVPAALSRQDTLVERAPRPAAPPAPPRRSQRGLVLAVIFLGILAVAAIVLAVMWPFGSDEPSAGLPAQATNTPPVGPTNVVVDAASPTPAQIARATETPLPSVPPPATETLALTPTVPAPPVAPPHTAPVGPPPVIGYFRANPSTLVQGECTRLEWGEVQNVSRLTLSGVGPVASEGKLDVCLDATKIYTLQATGPGGSSEESVQVTVNPPAAPVIEYFRVVPSIVRPGDCAQLEWGKVDNATSAAIEPGIGGVGTPGSAQVCPAETTTYVLTAQNDQAGNTARATLIVSTEGAPAPVIAFFTANPAQIQAGECTTLSWGKVDYASEVTIDHDIGGVATPGSKEVCLGTTTTYVITALGPGGTTETELTVTVSPGQLGNLPDLVVESILFEPNPCYRLQKCKVRIKIRNDGTLAADHFVLRWAPQGRETVSVEWDLLGLAAGEEKELDYTWIPDEARENWPTTATVDAYKEVDELEEAGTNSLEQAITVLEP